jgi:hypothetical protein
VDSDHIELEYVNKDIQYMEIVGFELDYHYPVCANHTRISQGRLTDRRAAQLEGSDCV